MSYSPSKGRKKADATMSELEDKYTGVLKVMESSAGCEGTSGY